MKVRILLVLVAFVGLCNIYAVKKEDMRTPHAQTEYFFKTGLKAVIKSLDDLSTEVKTGDAKKIKASFVNSRLQFKRIEFLTEYYYPYLARQINGPALPFSDGENSLKILDPEGYQVIEELIFPGFQSEDGAALIKNIDLLKGNFLKILNQQYPFGFQDQYIFEAMRYEVYRIIAQGISGFDSPVAYNSLPEAEAALNGLSECVSFFDNNNPQNQAKNNLLSKLQLSRNYLRQNDNFNKFDRLLFIKNYTNRLSGSFLAFQKQLGIILQQRSERINTNAPSLFTMDSFDPAIFGLNVASAPSPQKIELGKKLFFDPILSGNNKVSCASCHNPALAFTDGLTKSIAFDQKSTTARNAPTLLNAAFQPKQFYDSRAVFLEDQVFDVVHNATEMSGSLDKAALLLNKDREYTRLFNGAYPAAQSILVDNITNALASYIRSLVSLNSRFDQFMKGNENILSESEKQGFNIYMGKAKCGTCHYVPLFNGVAPPYFAESESEVLGVPDHADKKIAKLDADLGKYNRYKIAILKHSFKTPTLRNIAVTAPYMHNGVFKTLEEVVDFYNDGGGAGWKIGPDNQTLGTDPLGLSKSEKTKLIAFLKTLTDIQSR